VFGYGYTNHGTTPLTEDSPFGVPRGDAFDPHIEAMASTERQAMHTEDIEGIALRYGLFLMRPWARRQPAEGLHSFRRWVEDQHG
jgi:hypothetical protein